jgi:cellulose synthase/poly-beta-1,6-N-acetylglucosamine synthase-like glycosyltransferase
MAFKKSALRVIRSDASTDDFEITLALRRKGFKSLALSDVFIEEDSLENMAHELNQIRRRAEQGILSLVYYRTMLFNPRYGLYGIFILPSRRFFPLLLPFFGTVVIGLALFLWSKVIVIIAVVIFLILLFVTDNLYKLLQLYGVTLGWVDAAFSKNKADVWMRKTQ